MDTANTRVHGTTGEVPNERLKGEQTHLKPLPVNSYIPMITLGRRITKGGLISYNGNECSVPEGLMTSEIQIWASLKSFTSSRLESWWPSTRCKKAAAAGWTQGTGARTAPIS